MEETSLVISSHFLSTIPFLIGDKGNYSKRKIPKINVVVENHY